MKYALILGARSDMARAVAHKFAEQGFHLYLAARNADTLENDVKDYQIRHTIQAQSIEFDALDFGSHAQFYTQLTPKPEVVISLIGYLGDQYAAEKDPIETLKILNTNYTGCVSILNCAANEMEESQRGSIIGVSSVAGERGRAKNYFYGSAKAGFTAYLSGLRNRLHKSGVHVMTVHPGFVDTKMTENIDTPALLTAQPEQTAHDIYRAWSKKKDKLWTLWFWRYIMLIIRSIPEFLFKKMDL